MLRLYSIMQLGPLWTRPPSITPDSSSTDDATDDDSDDSIIEVHPVAVETTDIQEQHEEPIITGYQASNEADQRISDPVTTEENESTSSTPATTAFSSSFSLSAVSDPGLPILPENQHFVATKAHVEDHEEEEKENSIQKYDYYYYQPPPQHHQRLHFNRPVLQHLHIHPPYQDDLPPLTYDLTCIIEEDQTEINDSSMISSIDSLPKTPTSTVSTPLRRRKRPEIKFTERRKNIAKKLKQVFSSKNSKHRNTT
ncbi:unnamed protein product [Absidia cylindrospora]